MRLNKIGTGLKSWYYFEIAEVTYDVSIFLLVTFVLQPEDNWYKLRKAEQFCDDGISPGHNPKNGLAAQVILRQKVHHDRELSSARHRLGSSSHETTLARIILLARASEHQLGYTEKAADEITVMYRPAGLDCQRVIQVLQIVNSYWMKYYACTWHAYSQMESSSKYHSLHRHTHTKPTYLITANSVKIRNCK